MHKHLIIPAKAALFSAILSLLSACSSGAPAANEVAQAYETSGLVPVQPYTRSIFNSHNF